MDAIDITAIIIVSLNYFIIIPIIIYFLHQFRQYRQDVLIQHRSDINVYIMNIVVIFALIFERGYALDFYFSHPIQNLFSANMNIEVPLWSVYLLFSFTWTAILTLFACKAFNLYFQQQFNLAISDLGWRQNINPNDQNWFIKHKQTFGNSLYLIKFSAIPYSLFVILQSLCVAIIGLWSVFLPCFHHIFPSEKHCFYLHFKHEKR